MQRDVWEPVPYEILAETLAVGVGFPDDPKHNQFINFIIGKTSFKLYQSIYPNYKPGYSANYNLPIVSDA